MASVSRPEESGWLLVAHVVDRLLDIILRGGRPWVRLLVIAIWGIVLVVVVRVPLPGELPGLPEFPVPTLHAPQLLGLP